jgi:hypothetical protein
LRNTLAPGDDHRMYVWTALWIGVGAIAAMLVMVFFFFFFFFFRGSSPKDLGPVSDQWVSQHRASDSD